MKINKRNHKNKIEAKSLKEKQSSKVKRLFTKWYSYIFSELSLLFIKIFNKILPLDK